MLRILLIVSGFVLFLGTASAEEAKDEYTIVIKDHKMSPAEVKVPAGKRVKLVVDNQDTTPEEFESYDMNVEKVINGGSKGTIFIGPLDKGTYKFFGEFNMESAKGVVIAE